MSTSSETDPEAIVFDYLEAHNRPYSVNNIVKNLHNGLGKTTIKRALEKLVQNGKVCEKTYGRQTIYWLDQSRLSEASPDELRLMDNHIVELEKRLKVEDSDLDQLTAELDELNSSLTNEGIKAEATMHFRLVEQLRKQSTGVVGRDARARDENLAALARNRKEWHTRKRLAKKMAEPVLDQSGLSKDVLFQEIGLMTDEDAGVLPSRVPLYPTLL